MIIVDYYKYTVGFLCRSERNYFNNWAFFWQVVVGVVEIFWYQILPG